MKKIGLIAGEDCDFPKDAATRLKVSIYPYPIAFRKFKDNRDFYRLMKSDPGGEAPKTSQPSQGTFIQYYKKMLSEYDEILVFCLSSKFSGSYNSAVQAKKNMPADQKRIYIIDSKCSTGAEALLVMLAAKGIHKNLSAKEVVLNVQKKIENVHIIGVIDDPIWLQKGGRINSVQATIVKNMLKMGFRPILTLKDGQIVTKKIQRNARNRAEALFNQFKEDVLTNNDNKTEVIITHADCEDEAKKLARMVEKYSKNITIKYVNILSPVLGAHLGPGALLISYL